MALSSRTGLFHTFLWNRFFSLLFVGTNLLVDPRWPLTQLGEWNVTRIRPDFLFRLLVGNVPFRHQHDVTTRNQWKLIDACWMRSVVTMTTIKPELSVICIYRDYLQKQNNGDKSRLKLLKDEVINFLWCHSSNMKTTAEIEKWGKTLKMLFFTKNKTNFHSFVINKLKLKCCWLNVSIIQSDHRIKWRGSFSI